MPAQVDLECAKHYDIIQLIGYLFTYLPASGCCCHFITMVVTIEIPVPVSRYYYMSPIILRGLEIIYSPVILYANVVYTNAP